MDEDMEAPELPVEIIVYILSFLHASDRREASMVCRSWYSASQDLRFQKNVTFCFPASASSLELIRGLGGKSHCSLIISQLDGFSMSRSLLLEVGLCLGSKLESLALPGSSITEASLLALLPRLTSLRRLDLRGLDSLFMSGAFLSREEHRQQVRSALSGLEELDLSDLRYLSDLTFNRLTGCTPHLRRLSLAGCHIAFEFDPYRGCPVGAVEDSSALLSLRNLRRLLTEQKSTLVALDLSRTSITPESLRSIAQVQDLVLEELCLHGCKELTDYSVEVLVKHQPSLQRVDISACTELTNRSVEAIARGLKSLTHLSLSCDWRITEKGLADLLSVSSLRTLDLSECLHVSGTEMVKGLTRSSAARAQLETLSLKSCTYIRDLAVLSLTQLLGETLRELDLTSCVNVTDLSVRAIATYLQRLVVLRLGWCKEVTDWGLLGMVETSKCEPDQEMGDKGPRFTRTFGNMGFFKPPRLPFEERPKLVTQNDLEQFKQQAGASLLALNRLQELDLSACPKLTDSSITQVVRYPDLHRLSLSMLPEITDASLASVAWHCRSLTSLALSHCPGISDHGVAQAAPYLHRLQHFYLSCCTNITDRSLFLLLQHCKRLRTLDISRCKNISLTTVDLLQSQLPFLENVHCKYIGGSDLTLAF
ncbi:F-box/LRR-repeat protein 2 isoform X2 [Micropterus salmoides]|uniref:F-box/LRR-repeat protein 2 isoform X1 n=2 Tax=Micropterus salmoides TaxID=27706 RepID=UPI0018EE0E6F|nr:F-box/LRR-repeat protein 2 isoform X1 [Micropterus salmoides]XP_038561334.1 F-box/LRR-repeat protein 2 isoform X2 [Micropterus salmoides]